MNVKFAARAKQVFKTREWGLTNGALTIYNISKVEVHIYENYYLFITFKVPYFITTGVN